MEVQHEKKDCHILIFLSIIIGLMFFILFYGIQTLDVTNTAWLTNGEDLEQHYLGWCFFRNSDWFFPFGLHDRIASPELISVVYTDSIPLFAIFFKILSPILPQTFQYMGLFVLMCFILQAFFAILIARRSTDSKLLWACAGIFFIVAPVMLQRVFTHTALSAHFLILAAYALWAYKKELNFKLQMICWGILGVLCPAIQMYFLPMVGIILAASVIEELIDKKWNRLWLICIFCVAAVGCAYLLGFFSSAGVSSSTNGLGYYNANLNSLYNSLNKSTFLKGFAVLDGQAEGSAYLGFGILIMLMIAIAIEISVRSRSRRNMKRMASCAFLIVAVCFYAILNRVAMNDIVILEYRIPSKLFEVMSIFRTSGRFMWVIAYGIMIYAIFTLIRNSKTTFKYVIMITCLILQVIDVYPFYTKHFDDVTKQSEVVQSDDWYKISSHYKHLVLIDGIDYQVNSTNRKRMYEFAEYAANSDMTINIFFLARPLTEIYNNQLEETLTDLQNGEGSQDTLYVFSGDYVWDQAYPGLNLYDINGIIVGTYLEEDLEQADLTREIINLESDDGQLYAMNLSNGLYKIEIEGNGLLNMSITLGGGMEYIKTDSSDDKVVFLFSVDTQSEVTLTLDGESFEIYNCKLYIEQCSDH